MSEIKPIVPEELLVEIVSQQFGRPPIDLKLMEGGLVAQAFTFSVSGQHYVVRFNTNKLGVNFEKEAYIAGHFNAALIPIPAIIKVGQVFDLCYCISERAIGNRLDQLSDQEIQRALPAVIQTLDAIHAANVSQQLGYGVFDDEGQGLFPSWSAFLTSVKEEEQSDSFFGKWHHLFETGFLERDIFERIYSQMERLLGNCPEQRYLVHGDYGFSNLLVADGQVTAVLDWINAAYGDFLYDVAWLDFWDTRHGYRELFRMHHDEHGIDILNFEKRLVCYQCYIALNSLRFFAKLKNAPAYQWVKERIMRFIPAG